MERSSHCTRHLFTSAYHPRSNGAVERLNGEIERMITKYVNGAPHKWDEFIDPILIVCRSRVHSTTSEMPYKLVLGIQPNIPGDDVVPFLFGVTEDEDVICQRIQELEDLNQSRSAAIERAKLSNLRYKKYNDMKVKPATYYVGDYVFLHKGLVTKFELKCEEPFRVINVFEQGTLQLIYKQGNIKIDLVNQDRVKLANLSKEEKDEFSFRCNSLVEHVIQIHQDTG